MPHFFIGLLPLHFEEEKAVFFLVFDCDMNISNLLSNVPKFNHQVLQDSRACSR